MVQLIKIERLGPRIEGMLYRRKFDETWTLLDDVSTLHLVVCNISEPSCRALGSCQKPGTRCSMRLISKSCSV